jgi:hypothetical protein
MMDDWEPKAKDFEMLNGKEEGERLEHDIDIVSNGRIYFNNFKNVELLTFDEVMFQIGVWTQAVLLHGDSR